MDVWFPLFDHSELWPYEHWSGSLCVDIHDFFFLEKISTSGIVGLNRTFMFNFLRSCQTVFQIGYTVFCSHRQSVRVLVSLLCCPFLCSHSSGFEVFLIFISLMTYDVEHLLMFFLAVYLFR